MNSMNARIAVGGLGADLGARSSSTSHPEKPPVRDTLTQSFPHTRSNPVQAAVSFSTYGPRNEHLVVVVTDNKTGEVIREIPSQEMQNLHVHLEVMV